MTGREQYKKPVLQMHGSVASLTLGKPGSDLGAPGTGMGMGGGPMGMSMGMGSR